MLPDYVRRSHQSDLSKTSKHWDIFLSHCTWGSVKYWTWAALCYRDKYSFRSTCTPFKFSIAVSVLPHPFNKLLMYGSSAAQCLVLVAMLVNGAALSKSLPPTEVSQSLSFLGRFDVKNRRSTSLVFPSSNPGLQYSFSESDTDCKSGRLLKLPSESSNPNSMAPTGRLSKTSTKLSESNLVASSNSMLKLEAPGGFWLLY